MQDSKLNIGWVNAIKDQAEQEAYKYFNDNIRPLPKTSSGKWDVASGAFRNTDVDAFRHAYVSGVFTQKFNELIAYILGELNELHGDISGNSFEERNMDLWNNAIGRKYGSLTNLDPRIYKGEDLLELIDPNRSVRVIEQTETGRNISFLDSLTGLVMTRESFVSKIESGDYPNYTVALINNIPTPISKSDGKIENNLG